MGNALPIPEDVFHKREKFNIFRTHAEFFSYFPSKCNRCRFPEFNMSSR